MHAVALVHKFYLQLNVLLGPDNLIVGYTAHSL